MTAESWLQVYVYGAMGFACLLACILLLRKEAFFYVMASKAQEAGVSEDAFKIIFTIGFVVLWPFALIVMIADQVRRNS